MLRKELFKKFFPLIDIKHIKETNREISFLFVLLDKLHSELDVDLSVDELEASFWVAYPTASHDIYDGIFADLRGIDISAAVGEHVLAAITRQKLSIELSEASFELSQGRGSLDTVQRLVGALGESRTTKVGTEVFDSVTTDLEVLVNNVVNTPGLRWRLDCLNKSLGSLRKGDFGFIFARPETGKTTFLASEVSSMLDEAENPIIWFNNEEQGEKVMMRFYQGYFGVTLDTLLANAKQYKKLFHERVGGKFILVDNAGIDCRSIERIVHSVQPSLIIYDQIDKIKGFKADRDDLVYGAIYQWAREISKTYAPTIGVCQADGTGEGQKWLSMGHVSNAKTSKQAEADWILGLGKTHEETAEFIRYINLSKNKLMGDKDSIPSLRHGRFEVLIQPEVARFKDIVKYE